MTPEQKTNPSSSFPVLGLIFLGLIVLGLEQLNPGQSVPALIVGGALFTVGLAAVLFKPDTPE